MKRKDREIDPALALESACGAEYGIIATYGENGFPYAIPFHFACCNGKIYLHCTVGESHLRDNISRCPEVCFTTVNSTELLPDKFSAKYESTVIFGMASEVADATEKRTALTELIKKYSPDFYESGLEYIERDINRTTVIGIEIMHVTGKAHR